MTRPRPLQIADCAKSSIRLVSRTTAGPAFGRDCTCVMELGRVAYSAPDLGTIARATSCGRCRRRRLRAGSSHLDQGRPVGTRGYEHPTRGLVVSWPPRVRIQPDLLGTRVTSAVSLRRGCRIARAARHPHAPENSAPAIPTTIQPSAAAMVSAHHVVRAISSLRRVIDQIQAPAPSGMASAKTSPKV